MSKRKPLQLGGLFNQLIEERETLTAPHWEPEEFPILDGVTHVELDFETTGLKWWDPKHTKPIGFGLSWKRPGDIEHSTRYFSWGHRTDHPRHDEETAKRWMREQLGGKILTNSNVKLEVHVAQEWDVSFEDIGVRVSDIGHQAALLDDHRREFKQEKLCIEFLQDEEKVQVVNGITIEPHRMASYAPGIVAVRAEADVRQVRKLREHFYPKLVAEDLLDVLLLEDECTYATCEMERNGALIDVEKLHLWQKQCRREYEQLLFEINRRSGIKFNPNSNDDWVRLCRSRGVEPHTFSANCKASFKAEVVDGLIEFSGDDILEMGKHAGKLADLLSRYLDPYAKTVESDGILRFNLHQLKSDEGGTVSGRFSCAAIDLGSGPKVGANIQAVLGLEKQLKKYGPNYIIRELFTCVSGVRVVSADASQIEYRLFAHFANNPRVIEAYRQNPHLSFHELILGYVHQSLPDFEYKPMKNTNFMKIYGGGLPKLAHMIGTITTQDMAEINAMMLPNGQPDWNRRNNDPRLAKAIEIQKIYDRELPEVAPMLKQAQKDALHQGFVQTLLRRKMRFPKYTRPDGTVYILRPHKALNGKIQGSAGDVMKRKMIEVHRARKRIGFTPRLTIHDQFLGDGDRGTVIGLKEILNVQTFELRVPILWAVDSGAHWRECDTEDKLEPVIDPGPVKAPDYPVGQRDPNNKVAPYS